MPTRSRRNREADGWGAASQDTTGVLHPAAQELTSDFYRLEGDAARAVFADHWLRLASRQLDKTWPALYELLRIVNERALFRDPAWNEAKRAYADFREYFVDVVGQPFTTWAELEAAHHYVSTYAPELANASLKTVSAVIEMALNTVPLPKNGEIGNGRSRFANSKPKTKGGTTADYLTARIARDHPAILQDMKDGKYRSVRQAALAAGIVRPRASLYADDPDAAAAFLAKHFEPDDIKKITNLALFLLEGSR